VEHSAGKSPRSICLKPQGPGCAFLDYDKDGWMDIYSSQSAGVDLRAERLNQQLDGLQPLRPQAQRELLVESRKHPAVKLVPQIPSIGPLRAALLVVLLQIPHPLRTRRQLWAHSGQPLLELFAVVVPGGLLDFVTNLLDPILNCRLPAVALDDRRIVLVDGDLLSLPDRSASGFQLDAEILGEGLATGPPTWPSYSHRKPGLYGACFESSAQLLGIQSGQGFPIHFFRNHQQGFARLGEVF